MQIDTNTLIYILFAFLGIGWKIFIGWTRQVDAKLDDLFKKELVYTGKFVSKQDFAESKDHIWQKCEKIDQSISDHERRLSGMEKKP